MTTITRKSLSVALLAVAASAAVGQNQDGNNQGQNTQGCIRMACVRAPEIDPAQALGALALLGGTVAIVRGYRRKKK